MFFCLVFLLDTIVCELPAVSGQVCVLLTFTVQIRVLCHRVEVPSPSPCLAEVPSGWLDPPS